MTDSSPETPMISEKENNKENAVRDLNELLEALCEEYLASVL